MAKVEHEAQDRWGNDQVGPFSRNHLPCFLEASSQSNKHAHELATGFKLHLLYQKLKADDDSGIPARGPALLPFFFNKSLAGLVSPPFKCLPPTDNSLPSSACPAKISTGAVEAAYEILHTWIPINVF